MRRMTLDQMARMIEGNEMAAAGKSMTIGFDGFVDTIVRIVRERDGNGRPLHFRHKSDFGHHLVDRAAHNSSFELTEITTKIGGNMPITAHALGRLGVQVRCIGMSGYPAPHSLFSAMDANCALYGFAEPTLSTALEFDDGKVLLAKGETLGTIGWAQVKNAVGLETLVALYRDADAIGFANWGEIEHATDIWEGIEGEVLESARQGSSPPIAMFDLADCSRRTADDFAKLSELIGRLSSRYETILCLNRNEVLELHRMLRGTDHAADVEFAGAALFAALDVHTLIVRHPRAAIAWTNGGVVTAETSYVEHPLLSTGGGDNFNAGFCFARLSGLDTEPALMIASAVAGFYVTAGDSPTPPQLAAFLRNWAASGAPEEVS